MWTVSVTTPTGTTTTACAVTRADARSWGRQYSTSADTITIARLIAPETRDGWPCTAAGRVAMLTDMAHDANSETGSDAPGSRYGTRPYAYVPYAVAAHLVMSHSVGAEDTVAELDAMLGLVVNDHASVAELIADGWWLIPRGLRADLGGLRHVRALAAS